MRSRRFVALGLATTLLALVAAVSVVPGAHEDRVQVAAGSDEHAIEVAQAVMGKMGGWEQWDATRFVSWNFFGRRMHHWDRQTGDIRIVTDKNTILMNIDSKKGRVWAAGEELTDAAERDPILEAGHKMWVNDSYWMFMPYKLLDPGVTIESGGEGELEDGRAADVLVLTFEEVGYTPENKYEVFVARDSGLVEQWAFYAKFTDDKPGFTLPWANWKKFGGIMLATAHGQDAEWEIAVHDTLPRTLFTEP